MNRNLYIVMGAFALLFALAVYADSESVYKENQHEGVIERGEIPPGYVPRGPPSCSTLSVSKEQFIVNFMKTNKENMRTGKAIILFTKEEDGVYYLIAYIQGNNSYYMLYLLEKKVCHWAYYGAIVREAGEET